MSLILSAGKGPLENHATGQYWRRSKQAPGECGEPLVGDPLEYDELVIEHIGGTTRIGIFNRGITLLTTNEEFYKRVHRVCETIEQAGKVTWHELRTRLS